MSAGAGGYAGDVSAKDAFEALKADADAVLIDVRTRAEWTFVGLPHLEDIGKRVHLVEWAQYPSMEPNPQFLAELEQAAPANAPVYFLCRSGQRSKSAAVAATGKGYARAYNIAGGFEGDLDGTRHRGTQNGWKAEGLPWVQG